MKEKIISGDWLLVVDLDGGRIEELRFKGELILGTFKRKDGKVANSHLCLPNFGDEGMDKFGLEFHGPFRKMGWSLVNKGEDKIEIEAVALDLRVRQVFEINNDFKQSILVENLSDNKKIVNVAIHNYWNSDQGWRGTKLNEKEVDTLIMSDVDGEIKKDNLIEIGKNITIKWQLEGFKYVQFWTGFTEEDGIKSFDENYFCIEPCLERQGFLDNGENNLRPKEKMELSQKIGVVYRT